MVATGGYVICSLAAGKRLWQKYLPQQPRGLQHQPNRPRVVFQTWADSATAAATAAAAAAAAAAAFLSCESQYSRWLVGMAGIPRGNSYHSVGGLRLWNIPRKG